MFNIYKLIETNDYWIKDNKFIFKWRFNEKLDKYYDLVSKYNCLIFSNYNTLDRYIETKNIYKENYGIEYEESNFNQKVDLPLNLLHVTFGYNFNQKIKLPINLKYLKFDYKFNQEIELPPNLTHLTFGCKFNQEIKLPQNLIQLTFGKHFNQRIDIPIKVKYLKLDCNNLSVIEYLPNSIKELELCNNFNLELNNLPSSIKIIKFSKESNYNKELNNLPNSVEIIQLPEKYNKKISKIPKKINKIL